MKHEAPLTITLINPRIRKHGVCRLENLAGNDFPTRLHRHSSIRYGDTFLVMGGKAYQDATCDDECTCTGGRYTDAIWK